VTLFAMASIPSSLTTESSSGIQKLARGIGFLTKNNERRVPFQYPITIYIEQITARDKYELR